MDLRQPPLAIAHDVVASLPQPYRVKRGSSSSSAPPPRPLMPSLSLSTSPTPSSSRFSSSSHTTFFTASVTRFAAPPLSISSPPPRLKLLYPSSLPSFTSSTSSASTSCNPSSHLPLPTSGTSMTSGVIGIQILGMWCWCYSFGEC